MGQRLEDAVEGEPESDGTELKGFEITRHPTKSSAHTETQPQQAAIADIIESAVYWISEDADNPVTPPAEWQAVIPMLQASPKMQQFIAQVAGGNTEYDRLQEIAHGLNQVAKSTGMRDRSSIITETWLATTKLLTPCRCRIEHALMARLSISHALP